MDLLKSLKAELMNWSRTCSKTVMIQGISVENLLENHVQDSKYNVPDIKTAIIVEINSFVSQLLPENDITGINFVCLVCKHLKVMLSSSNMKSAILQGARLSKLTNFYVSEYLTRKHSTLFYKLCVMKK